MKTQEENQYQGINPGILAVLFTLLFNTGLSFVTSMSGKPSYYPGPWETTQIIQNYFSHHQHDVLMCGFFQFIAAVLLGLLAVSLTTRLQSLGNRSVGPLVTLFGGIFVSISLALSALLLWVMAYPNIADNSDVLRALYYASYAMGGVGYSMPLGLMIAGVAVSAAFMRLLSKWLIVFGIIVAICGVLSPFSLIFPKLLALIPLTRFPGFIWLIIVGFKLGSRNLRVTCKRRSTTSLL